VPTIATMTNQSSARDVLTQAEAEQRARRVGQADYYRGDLTLRFECAATGRCSSTSAAGDRPLEVNGSRSSPTGTATG
jgi:hypothetical protein